MIWRRLFQTTWLVVLHWNCCFYDNCLQIWPQMRHVGCAKTNNVNANPKNREDAFTIGNDWKRIRGTGASVRGPVRISAVERKAPKRCALSPDDPTKPLESGMRSKTLLLHLYNKLFYDSFYTHPPHHTFQNIFSDPLSLFAIFLYVLESNREISQA